MTDPDLIRLFIEPFERSGLSYMVTGGVASVVYGDPRFTRDVDVVLALDATGVADLEESFAGDDFYVPPEETLLEEAARKRGGHFNFRSSGSDRHLRDVAMMLRISGDLVNADVLKAWSGRMELEDELEGAREYDSS